MDAAAILSALANVAAVATSVVASVAYLRYLSRKKQLRIRLENYLSDEKREDELEDRHGTRSVLHLMGNLAMTEEEVLAAAFASKNIKSWIGMDEAGRADRLLFQFSRSWRRPKPRAK